MLTLLLHKEMLSGRRTGLAVAMFIGIYWLLRVVVDFTYYEHADWPSGKEFIIGHALLTALFVFLFETYLGVSLRGLLA